MIYIFKRNKKTGHKTTLFSIATEAAARAYCKEVNHQGGQYWYEFTTDPEYLKN